MVAKIRIFNLFGIPFFCGGCLRNEKHRGGGAVGRGRVTPERHCTMLLVLITVSFLREVSSFLNFDGERTRLYISTAFWTSSFTSPKLFSCVSKSHPFFTVLLILSARALCRGSPVWVILALIPRSCNSAMYFHCSNIECLGRSGEWVLLGWHDWLYRSR